MGLYIAPEAKSTIVLGQNKMMSAINTINNFIFLITLNYNKQLLLLLNHPLQIHVDNERAL